MMLLCNSPYRTANFRHDSSKKRRNALSDGATIRIRSKFMIVQLIRAPNSNEINASCSLDNLSSHGSSPYIYLQRTMPERNLDETATFINIYIYASFPPRRLYARVTQSYDNAKGGSVVSALSADTSETVQTEKRSRAPRNFYSIEMDDDRGGSRRVARPCSAAAAPLKRCYLTRGGRMTLGPTGNSHSLPSPSVRSQREREREGVRTDGGGRFCTYVPPVCELRGLSPPLS